MSFGTLFPMMNPVLFILLFQLQLPCSKRQGAAAGVGISPSALESG